MSTIRSYRDGERFQDANTALIEANETAWYCYCACNRWLGYRLDILGTTIAFITTLISVTQVRIVLSKQTRLPSKVTAIVVLLATEGHTSQAVLIVFGVANERSHL
eukprot:COSAG04_NODE_1192_length_7801_cov_7.001298_12_plen_106_part_00